MLGSFWVCYVSLDYITLRPQHVAAGQGISSNSTNSTHTLNPGHVAMYLPPTA